MIPWLKAFHIVALSVWCAGLMSVPLLLARRPALAEGSDEFYRLQLTTRFVFVVLVSPAAFIAIGTGTALIFARETFTMWFAIKLLFVGALAKLHIYEGTKVVDVFKEDGRYGFWSTVVGISTAALLTTAILTVVLAKPTLAQLGIPADLLRPGGLGAWVNEWLGFRSQPSSVMTMPTP